MIYLSWHISLCLQICIAFTDYYMQSQIILQYIFKGAYKLHCYESLMPYATFIVLKHQGERERVQWCTATPPEKRNGHAGNSPMQNAVERSRSVETVHKPCIMRLCIIPVYGLCIACVQLAVQKLCTSHSRDYAWSQGLIQGFHALALP